MVRINESMRAIILILVLLIALDGGLSVFRLMSTSPSYQTGYEGVKARFAGVSYEGKNHKKTLWGSTFNWDADKADGGLPDIAGEMTSVFIPKESVGAQPVMLGGKDISHWLLGTTSVRNPVATYEWELSGNSTTTLYVMEEWELRWFVSLSCEPAIDNELESVWFPDHLKGRNSLKNVDVWFEFDLQPVWYFEGTDATYFAIAKLQLAEDVAMGARHYKKGYVEKGGDEDINDQMRVTPSSSHSVVSIYHGLFGKSANIADKDAYSYQGKDLNPDLFTDKVYAKLTLDDFGVSSWYAFGTHWRSDVVTYAFKMRVFVIGEWTVKDIDELPDEYGKTSKTGGLNVIAENPFIEFLGSGEGKLLMAILAGLAVLLLLAIFAPTALLALFAIFGGKKRR